MFVSGAFAPKGRLTHHLLLIMLLVSGSAWADANDAHASPGPPSFERLAQSCAPSVAPDTLAAIVATESSGNPYAIGIVGAHLDRQPRSRDEAIAVARDLEARGYNFSMGLGQVNRFNLARLGETYESVFDPCRNLRAGSAILTDCYQRAANRFAGPTDALRAALSCYYSGNFTTGIRQGYVRKVVANVGKPITVVPSLSQSLIGDATTFVQNGTEIRPTRAEPRAATVPHDDDLAIGRYIAPAVLSAQAAPDRSHGADDVHSP
ncbi:lytic transglycosylase domain-containing protein [Burkholderia glumae]|uniref:lytic transglycosylase domain-containing protein n=1 Tax=Burkholderia glumae TaxID=337 RepID=UPI0020CE5364|nr:lytic transglycosylase domain-containing protein [Burkholderia glumae]MCQ0031486.1 lytic transglycosylase domain-containing protein [Burkholderia glumae]MCQ0035138.1 lytic transglycosylase domain-containing protein [Burkholderia glumae]